MFGWLLIGAGVVVTLVTMRIPPYGDPLLMPGVFFGRPWLHTFVKVLGPAMVLGGILRLILH